MSSVRHSTQWRLQAVAGAVVAVAAVAAVVEASLVIAAAGAAAGWLVGLDHSCPFASAVGQALATPALVGAFVVEMGTDQRRPCRSPQVLVA